MAQGGGSCVPFRPAPSLFLLKWGCGQGPRAPYPGFPLPPLYQHKWRASCIFEHHSPQPFTPPLGLPAMLTFMIPFLSPASCPVFPEHRLHTGQQSNPGLPSSGALQARPSVDGAGKETYCLSKGRCVCLPAPEVRAGASPRLLGLCGHSGGGTGRARLGSRGDAEPPPASGISDPPTFMGKFSFIFRLHRTCPLPLSLN